MNSRVSRKTKSKRTSRVRKSLSKFKEAQSIHENSVSKKDDSFNTPTVDGGKFRSKLNLQNPYEYNSIINGDSSCKIKSL